MVNFTDFFTSLNSYLNPDMIYVFFFGFLKFLTYYSFIILIVIVLWTHILLWILYDLTTSFSNLLNIKHSFLFLEHSGLAKCSNLYYSYKLSFRQKIYVFTTSMLLI